jgi:hypothetical protein
MDDNLDRPRPDTGSSPHTESRGPHPDTGSPTPPLWLGDTARWVLIWILLGLLVMVLAGTPNEQFERTPETVETN